MVASTRSPSTPARGADATAAARREGQGLWIDTITRGMLDDGTLERYARDLAVSGLTSNPSIYNAAVGKTAFYDAAIREKVARGLSAEELFFELAIEDLVRAADLFRPVYESTGGVDGWVSLEVSPRLAYDTAATLRQAQSLYDRAARPNLFIKIPGTPEGLPAIEEAIARGVPVNVTLLFSPEQYLAAAEAFFRGIERRIESGLSPRIASVASLFISRWDAATSQALPPNLINTLGIAIGGRCYRAYREMLASDRFERACALGAMPQRLLFASTGVKDPRAPDTLYASALVAPNTINTLPEATLLAFADHGVVSGTLSAGGGDSERVLHAVERAGVDVRALGERLQTEGAAAFVKSWDELLDAVDRKSRSVGAVG